VTFLKVKEGSCPGQILELREERVLLGRHPQCQVVLDNAAVSRHHAQILQSHGYYYLEDLRSRNKTFLNDVQVKGREKLKDSDRITICDLVFQFYMNAPPVDDSTVLEEPISVESDSVVWSTQEEKIDLPGIDFDADEKATKQLSTNPLESSSIIISLDVDSGSSVHVTLNPEVKLRAILSLSRALSKVVQQDEVLKVILDTLFTIFPPADEGFILLKDNVKNKLYVRASKTRQEEGFQSVGNAQLSMTVILQALRSREAILSADAAEDTRFAGSESLQSLKIRSVMCVPLIDVSGEVLGIIQLNTKNIRSQFKSDDLETFSAIALQAIMAIDNAALHEELLQQSDMQHDLDIATQVQLGFLPSHPPEVAGYEFQDYYEAALQVGGDYFDYIPLNDGRVAIALGDVAGKGIPAALLMARLFASARFQLLTQPTLSAALAGLNAEMASSGLGHRFVTCIFALLDTATNDVTIVNAGHMAPLLRTASRTIKVIAQEESGLPLGISPNEQFIETTIRLKKGDTLVMYTDGITEMMDKECCIYGRERLIRYLEKSPEKVDDLVAGIVCDVEQYSADKQHRDDICIVGIHREK